MKTFAWMSVAAVGLTILGCNLTNKYTVGGTLTGLTGQGLVLEDNSGNDLEPRFERCIRFLGGHR